MRCCKQKRSHKFKWRWRFLARSFISTGGLDGLDFGVGSSPWYSHALAFCVGHLTTRPSAGHSHRFMRNWAMQGKSRQGVHVSDRQFLDSLQAIFPYFPMSLTHSCSPDCDKKWNTGKGVLNYLRCGPSIKVTTSKEIRPTCMAEVQSRKDNSDQLCTVFECIW